MTLRHRLDGPAGADVLVLSNSIGTTFELWDRQVPALSETFRVLRYDHPSANTIEGLAAGLVDLLDQLEVNRASLCGLSIGGAVGMWLDAHAPARIECLVLACTSAHFGPADGYHQRASLVRAEGMTAVAEGSLGRWLTPRFAGTAAFREMLLAIPPETYAGTCEALAGWDARELLPLIHAPTLVIAGAHDPATPPAHAELIAGGIAGAELVVIPDAAHFANVEQSEAFNAAVLAHLRQEVPA